MSLILPFTQELCDENPVSFLPVNDELAEVDLEHKIKVDSGIIEISKIGFIPEYDEILKFKEERVQFSFKSQPKPWFPPTLLRKLNRMKKGTLRPEELVSVIEEMARIAADFYQVNSGQAIAVKFDGQIVESGDSEIELLSKIQGKKFGEPIFVWQVGTESFSGWRT